MLKMTDELREQVYAAFAAGQNISRVAAELLNDNWQRAKKLHTEWQATQPGGATAALERKKHKAASEDSGESQDEDEWDLTVKLPTTRLDEILQTFSPAEKATAIQSVLQVRIDTALGIEG